MSQRRGKRSLDRSKNEKDLENEDEDQKKSLDEFLEEDDNN